MSNQAITLNQPFRQLRLPANGDPQQVVELHAGYHITTLAKDDVLVAMEAAPIHISDFMMVSGSYGIKPGFPAVLGAESVGCVIAAGSPGDSSLVGKLLATVGGTLSIENYRDAFKSATEGGRPGKYFFTFNQQ